jgi:hypothetical protein
MLERCYLAWVIWKDKLDVCMLANKLKTAAAEWNMPGIVEYCCQHAGYVDEGDKMVSLISVNSEFHLIWSKCHSMALNTRVFMCLMWLIQNTVAF